MGGNLKSTPEPLAVLETLSKEELAERFRSLYRRDPPKRIRREMLLRAVAHRVQELAAGGLKPAHRRRLVRLAEELKHTGRIDTGARPPIKPGTRLLREWQGTTHTVTVTADGYVYQGEHYRSLSRIARLITGTRWSGLAYFGLKEGSR